MHKWWDISRDISLVNFDWTHFGIISHTVIAIQTLTLTCCWFSDNLLIFNTLLLNSNGRSILDNSLAEQVFSDVTGFFGVNFAFWQNIILAPRGGGGVGDAPLPFTFSSFLSNIRYKLAKNYVGAHPSGKSWIRHCVYIVWYKNATLNLFSSCLLAWRAYLRRWTDKFKFEKNIRNSTEICSYISSILIFCYVANVNP